MAGRVCPWWMAYTFDNPLRRFHQKPEKILGPYVSQGMTVMDVGCGMGFFSIGMARIVGETGSVIAVDLQRKMLRVLRRRAKKAGLADRIRTHRCGPDAIGVDGPVDFALAFWMVHEVSDTGGFLRQVRSCLRPNGKFLVTEPWFHVSAKAFRRTLATAEDVGLKLSHRPPIRLCRTAVLVKQ